MPRNDLPGKSESGVFKTLFPFLILLSIIFAINLFHVDSAQEVSWDTFLNLVETRKVQKVEFYDDTIRAYLNDGTQVKTVMPMKDPSLIRLLRRKRVTIVVKKQSQFLYQLLSTIIYVGLLVGAFYLFYYFMGKSARDAGKQALFFAKSRARMYRPGQTKVTFKDVAGAEEAKEELQEVVEFLKNPDRFRKLGARIPRGILLVGPPGCGKTLLAKAVAGEAGVPFFSISGSDFMEMFVGVGAARVRDLFAQAKAHAPSIIFIDEIDAIGRHRGAGLGGGHDEREQTLNQLLVEMDGFETSDDVIVMAATNRPDILDPALLRPGRFDRHIIVDRPDVKGRLEILKIHARGKPLDNDVDLEKIAKRTPGFVGADLENLVNEAALLAARKNKKKISMEEFEEAIERVIAGPERKSRVISEKEKNIVAYHESGHALLAHLLPGTDPVQKISIIPRGQHALGYTLQVPIEDKYLISKEELFNNLVVLLGGRVAEELKFGDVTTGAQNDLQRATELARKMVMDYGMSDRIGPISWGGAREVFLGKDLLREKNYSEEIARMIDEEVEKLINKAYTKAKELLVKNWRKLEKLSRELLEKEVLHEEDIERILGKKKTPKKRVSRKPKSA